MNYLKPLASFLALGVVTSLHCVVPQILMNHTLISTSFDALSLSLNIILAAMIVSQIIVGQRTAIKKIPQRSTDGQIGFHRYQLTTIGIITESAFAWTLFGLLFVVARITGTSSSSWGLIFGALFELSGVRSTQALRCAWLLTMNPRN